MASANHSPNRVSYLAPLAGSLWIFFLVLSAIVAPIWTLDLGAAQIRAMVRVRELQTALLWLSTIVDVLWITVAATIVYSGAVRALGLATARRATLLILATSWMTGALSVWSGWPFGLIHFTGRFGFLLGSVSLGWLMIWCVIILGGRDLAMAAFPRASHTVIAAVAGVLAALTNLNLEPLASKTRAWWLFVEKSPSPPLLGVLQGPISWLLVAFLLSWSLREPVLAKRPSPGIPKSAQAFLLLHLLLLLAHLGGVLRR